jgi:adenylosuccinate lyase
MIKRYENPKIAPLWKDGPKLALWQRTELAAIKARQQMGEFEDGIYEQIETILLNTPIDLEYWLARDNEIHHDLNAFLDERVRNLPVFLQQYWHKDLTSFDTQEAAFATMILQSLEVIAQLYYEVESTLTKLARKYRYTIMNARTHGQEAELQTFGSRCLHWLVILRHAGKVVTEPSEDLRLSKLSGAIGRFGGVTPELEERTLAILGFRPFRGATQIMPRSLYLPTAQGLCALVQVMNQIALDIRLNARSGRPLMREPFKKKQKGSSAMPHKKNPIRCEQVEGLERMARNYLHMIEENVRTWEERAIEQSSVERVAWPDLFHVTARALSEMAYVLGDLKVYPDNMLLEVYESRGVYASREIKEFLKERMAPRGFTYEDAYRVVQLACFNVFEPPEDWKAFREAVPQNFEAADTLLRNVATTAAPAAISIQEFIPQGKLRVSDELEISDEQVQSYNECLREIFAVCAETQDTRDEWIQCFNPSEILKNEAVLYHDILGE